jgi:YVTN family beta-propeller protein
VNDRYFQAVTHDVQGRVERDREAAAETKPDTSLPTGEHMRLMRLLVGLGASVALITACGQQPGPAPAAEHYKARDDASGASAINVYLATGVGALSPAAAAAKPLVYVPNTLSGTVTVIDPATHTVIRTFRTGKLPQHVVPSYDMRRLWVTNDMDDSLTAIDPTTGADGDHVRVSDPYNLYFTPDGKLAIVIAEAQHRFDLRDAVTMKLVQSVHVDCNGLDHVDFTADDKYAIATCEFSGQLVKLDLTARKPVGYLHLQREAMPQDIRLSPNGRVMYVADMMADGAHVIDPVAFKEIGFIKMGKGTHGIVVGRGGYPFYFSNRGWNTLKGGRHGPGSITVLDPITQKILATWPIPNGGSPDMGGLSADGKELWVSGRYDQEVYAIDTTNGSLIARIHVGVEPHGLSVWPQPGRFSLGHTGNMR